MPSLSHSHPNAKSPDVPGGVDIAFGIANVSTCIPRNFDEEGAALFPRHCEQRSDAAIHAFFLRRHGLLRGACHRARVRATRWLAMTGRVRGCNGAIPQTWLHDLAACFARDLQEHSAL